MVKAQPFSAEDISSFLNELLEGDEHAKRVGSLANATLGAITNASPAVEIDSQGFVTAQAGRRRPATISGAQHAPAMSKMSITALPQFLRQFVAESAAFIM